MSHAVLDVLNLAPSSPISAAYVGAATHSEWGSMLSPEFGSACVASTSVSSHDRVCDQTMNFFGVCVWQSATLSVNRFARSIC